MLRPLMRAFMCSLDTSCSHSDNGFIQVRKYTPPLPACRCPPCSKMTDTSGSVPSLALRETCPRHTPRRVSCSPRPRWANQVPACQRSRNRARIDKHPCTKLYNAQYTGNSLPLLAPRARSQAAQTVRFSWTYVAYIGVAPEARKAHTVRCAGVSCRPRRGVACTVRLSGAPSS